MTDDLEQKIRTWLTRQGYPLEMRAARAFRGVSWQSDESAGDQPKDSRWEADQSVYYKNSEGKWREIDVEATIRQAYPGTKPWRAFEFIAVLECKSNTSKPWVVFSNEATAGPSIWGVESRAANSIGRLFLSEISFLADMEYDFFKVGEHTGYAAVRAFEEGNQDQAYAAVSSIVDAAQHRCRFDGNEHTARCRIVFPIIVTAAPVFECYLDEHNIEQIEPRDSITLYSDARVPGRQYSVIEIVREQALLRYIERLTELHKKLWIKEQEKIVQSFDLFERRRTLEAEIKSIDSKLGKSP
jgi:hypothetical protein